VTFTPPTINVVPPTPYTSFDPYASLFSPKSNRFAHWLNKEIANEEEQAVSSILFPAHPIDPEVVQRYVPLKHCYTDRDRHLWQEDYTNWCIKAQRYFDINHPRVGITLPAHRAFAFNQRGPLERYMLEVDAFPLHPDSEPFSMAISNGLAMNRDFVCFRCGQLKHGHMVTHGAECEHTLPFEQTVYYFAWESLKKSHREALLTRVPRVWQDTARMEWERGLKEIDRLEKVNDDQGRACRELMDKVEMQDKRLKEVEEEMEKVKMDMKSLKSKFRHAKVGKDLLDDGGKENKDSQLLGQWSHQRSGHELLSTERPRVKRTRIR
jgi:hypothetical protein